MIATLQSFAFSLPVLWARVYTVGLPTHERADRIDLIMSDVYEQRFTAAKERRSRFALLETLVCLIRGLWADFTWRFERGHALRVAAVRAGAPPFPVLITAIFALAGIAGAARLSIFHDIPRDEHIALILALLVGPLVAVVGIIVARQRLPTGILALAAGTGAIGFAAWSTIIAPVAAAIGFFVGLFAILETRNARRSSPATGRSAAPTSPPVPLSGFQEVPMDTTGKLERWMALGGLLFIASILCWIWFQAEYPHAPDTNAEITEGYTDANAGSAYAALLAAMFGGLGLILFFGGLYASMRRAEGGTGYLSATMLVGAGAAATFWMVLIGVTTSTAVAFNYEDEFKAAGVDPQTVRLLDVIGFTLATMAWAALALAMGALAYVSLRTHAVLAPWLAWATLAASILLLVSFPLFFLPTTLVPLWLLVTGGWRLLSGRGPVAAPTAGARPAPA